MAYINTNNDIPGIRGLFEYRKETAPAMNLIAQVLLADDHPSLTKSERELIATFVSHQNKCTFCMTTHGYIAAHHPDCNLDTVNAVWNDYHTAPVSDRMKSLLNIADKVRQSGRHVTEQDIAAARQQGASDLDLHDTVLIAAAFCMFNRYVDGLGAATPTDPDFYHQVGEQRAKEGYMTKSILVK